MNILTAVCSLAILGIAYIYYLPLRKLEKFINAWDKCNEAKDIESQYTGMKGIDDGYQETMFTLDDGQKTTSHAEDFYYRRNIARVIGVNLKAISSAPGLISGLGVLGTFIGLTASVTLFNSDTSEAIMQSIKILLGGMGTAFLTSVFGMVFSSLYIWQQKKIYNNFDIVTAKWGKMLDDKYYISELELLRMENVRQQNVMMDKLQAIHDSSEKQQKAYSEGLSDLKKQNEDYQKNVMDAIIGYDEEGNSIKPGDMLQNLYEESEKQSQALESFTTDLSNELNASLGKTMDVSIVPLIKNLENSHKVFNEKLDALSSNIQSPSTDMVTSVVGELKTSMRQMTVEYKDSISNDTLKQMEALETLADNLTKASDILNGIHQTMQMMAKSVPDSFVNIKDVIGQLRVSVESHQTEMVEKSKLANEEMSAGLNARLNEIIKQNEDYQKNVLDAIIGYDEEGNSIKPGDMLQNLYEESEKQSQALESFTTDLSNELNASLGKTMDTSIVPIIRDLENTHKVFNDKLDALSFGIQSPATDMVTSVVGELKTSMQQMTTEFKDNISTDTLKQMETLADNLTKSSDVLDGIPQTMQMMAESVTNSFANIKDIIGQLQTSVESQQIEMVEKSKSANEEISANMNARLNEVMNVIQATMTKLNEQQNGLIENQGKSTREIANLLNSFEVSINRMRQANVETAQTLVRVQKIGENLDESANKVKEMSATMKDVSDTLIDQQKESMEKYKEVQNANQGTVDNINATLKTTQQLITEYTQQYAVIQKGLKDIFAEISKGLQDYSTTLSKSTGDALGVYSNALDKSTKGLQNIAEALNESAEELTDGVDKLKMRLK